MHCIVSYSLSVLFEVEHTKTERHVLETVSHPFIVNLLSARRALAAGRVFPTTYRDLNSEAINLIK